MHYQQTLMDFQEQLDSRTEFVVRSGHTVRTLRQKTDTALESDDSDYDDCNLEGPITRTVRLGRLLSPGSDSSEEGEDSDSEEGEEGEEWESQEYWWRSRN